jgi:1,4-dihydroxy-6-naphthoate synthase
MSTKHLKIAISPCPNDTFIFGPWIKAYSNNETGLTLDIDYLDIQELNQNALKGIYDVIKISAAFVPKVLNRYKILHCGGALTDRTGPLLVSKTNFHLDQLKDKKVLLPGKDTTAAFIFNLLFPEVTQVGYAVFSSIEDRIINHEADAGVIIHESRFNYASKQLVNLLDLGEAWYQKTKSPVPLGVIAVKNSLQPFLQQAIQESIRQSIRWAWQHQDHIMPFIQSKAQELDTNTILQHIDLYVNEYSFDLGPKGIEAICTLCHLVEKPYKNPQELFI